MTLKSMFNTKNPMVLLFSIFYIIAGIVEIGYWALENFSAPPHIIVLGILSLITAYGLFKMKKWAVPLVIALFFIGVTIHEDDPGRKCRSFSPAPGKPCQKRDNALPYSPPLYIM